MGSKGREAEGARKMRKGILIDFLIPGVILGILTIVFRVTNLDTAIEGLFYSPEKGWFMGNANPWQVLYRYGNVPGLALASAGVVGFVVGFFYHKARKYRKAALFLGLVMVLGPGLVVNTAFKHYWGRPRPRQIQEFGGSAPYLPLWQKGVPGEGKSFPSGHASVAFYLFTPFFFLRETSKKRAVLFLALGVSYGVLMGMARMVQGGHFPSDVVWAGGFTYLTGLALSCLFRFDKRAMIPPRSSSERCR
jgi:lipid A 4'-phosphatase